MRGLFARRKFDAFVKRDTSCDLLQLIIIERQLGKKLFRLRLRQRDVFALKECFQLLGALCASYFFECFSFDFHCLFFLSLICGGCMKSPSARSFFAFSYLLIRVRRSCSALLCSIFTYAYEIPMRSAISFSVISL